MEERNVSSETNAKKYIDKLKRNGASNSMAIEMFVRYKSVCIEIQHCLQQQKKNERSAKAAQQFMRLFVAANEWEESKRKKKTFIYLLSFYHKYISKICTFIYFQVFSSGAFSICVPLKR